jgi:hypothetical protein
MMANEISESVRRNLLWERALSRRDLLGGFTARIPPIADSRPVLSRTPAEESARAHLARNKSWADDYHQSGW